MTKFDGHNSYDQFFWSRVVWHSHVRSYVANPTWHDCDQIRRSYNRFSPVQLHPLHGPSPTTQPIYYLFSCKFWSVTWAKTNNSAFYFLGQCLLQFINFLFRPFYLGAGPTSEIGPTCQASLKMVPHVRNFEIFQINSKRWSH